MKTNWSADLADRAAGIFAAIAHSKRPTHVLQNETASSHNFTVGRPKFYAGEMIKPA
jgi:hypothetical protein